MNILNINSSAKINGSRSRDLTAKISQKLKTLSNGKIIERDLTKDLSFITEAMIDRYYIPEKELSENDKKILAPSDVLVDELINCDAIVIGAPMYNFAIPGMLKSYLDQVCRLDKTFKTNPQGFEGLLLNKSAHIVITTGGTPTGGADDFISEYLTRVLDFIGITDVNFYVVDKFDKDDAQQQFQSLISRIEKLELPN